MLFKVILIWSIILVEVTICGTHEKSVIASRCVNAPVIDGKLDETEWELAVPASGFLQYDPIEGAEPTENTSVRVLYNDRSVFFGVMCYDSEPSGIIKQLTRRDRVVHADRFSIMIDSYHDHLTAFLFGGTVSGIQIDGILSHDGRVFDSQWDAVWKFNAVILSEGWSAEFEIPFSALRFTYKEGEYVWGINFRRYIARKKETVEWVMVRRDDLPPGTISSVSKMGHLSGICGISPPLNLSIMPYSLFKYTSFAQPLPFERRNEFFYFRKIDMLGFDLKYGLSSNFTLDLAVNPDFGQVEVDQAILNLTVFETFYPEKRPFFLEAAPLFTFGNMLDNRPLNLFYSRRIGKSPPVIYPDSGFIFAEYPKHTTILGAGKVTGRTDKGFSMGVISTITDNEYAIQENIEGLRKPKQLIERRANYNVFRIKQEILDNSTIGFMATGMFQEKSYPAHSGGIDWNLRLGRNIYSVEGYLAGSKAVVPYLNGSSVYGSAGRIGLGKLDGEHWLAFSFYEFSSRKFYIDNVGFYNQPREHGGFTQISYKEYQAESLFLRYVINGQIDYRWNWDGIMTRRRIELEPLLELKNFWNLYLNFSHEFPAYDDENRLSYEGQKGIVSLYKRPAMSKFFFTLQTDSRRRIVLWSRAGYQITTKGNEMFYGISQLTFQPFGWMDIAPSFTFARSQNEEGWVIGYFEEDSKGKYNLFADRNYRQYDFSIRGTLIFSRNISIQFFTQVFLFKSRYVNFRKLVKPDSFVNMEKDPFEAYKNVVNANVVLRWEYLPGSTIYLVWTQFRDGDRGLYTNPIFKDIREAFKIPIDNVFLAKISYWWSL